MKMKTMRYKCSWCRGKGCDKCRAGWIEYETVPYGKTNE